MKTIQQALREALTFRWNPGPDLAAVLVSVLCVTGTLYTATRIVTPEAGGGLPYFFLYAVLGATFFGVGFPLLWTVAYRRRPVSDLGITRRSLWASLGLQAVFGGLLYTVTLAKVALPAFGELLPLLGLALAIGFFEAVFWRGWVLQRLEAAFGFLPALVLGSALYAAYHVGYGMPLEEIAFLFWIGVLYAATFRLTRSLFVLWPVFQPMGQLVTLVRDGLSLPTIAAVGFLEAWVVMAVLVWLAERWLRRGQAKGKLAGVGV